MPVYVDDARISWRGRRWSHLVADLPDELHQAAAQLGLEREWAQERGRTLHYDVPDEVRRRAIDLDLAAPISWRALVRRRGTLASGSGSRRSSGSRAASTRSQPTSPVPPAESPFSCSDPGGHRPGGDRGSARS